MLRSLAWSDTVEPLDRVRVLTLVARRLDELADRQARLAVDSGETMADVGRALQLSRQAAWRRYAARRDAS